jgi:hypothetical protein
MGATSSNWADVESLCLGELSPNSFRQLPMIYSASTII